ncbi:hypothetical protein BSLA_02f5032 [Burkholderia stabilis]|nr:hypothetical protein BSLA_02f5032 [Burkholderia stabilis]
MGRGMDRGLQDVSPDVGMPALLRGIVCRLLRNLRARAQTCRLVYRSLIHKGFISSAERMARRPFRDFGIGAAGRPRFRPDGASGARSAWPRPDLALYAPRIAVPDRAPYRRARFSSHNRFVDRPLAALYHRLILFRCDDDCPENARAFAAASLIRRYRLWTGEWFPCCMPLFPPAFPPAASRGRPA